MLIALGRAGWTVGGLFDEDSGLDFNVDALERLDEEILCVNGTGE